MNDIRPAGVTSRFEIRIEEKVHVGADGTELVAIRDFALDVAPESMTVLMGPSGCGKTTMLRIVAGLDDRYAGKVGTHPDTRIGLMFQEPRLLPWRTVKQNIMLVAAPDFTEEDLERLAHSVGIADMLPRFPQELSLGLARRVALARAFATKPDLLLLEVWQARPTTAILVTHNAREAIMLADQLVLLAPRPTHVVAVETIAVPQAERDHDAIEAIHADLLRRYPANFSGH